MTVPHLAAQLMKGSSMTRTIALNGNDTGYGDSSGDEIFNVTNYGNTALLAGANDTVNILSGGYDTIDLNSTGFTNAVTDSILLGASDEDIIEASHVLYDSTIQITGTGGPNLVSFVNHGGTTSIALGTAGNAVGGANAPLILNGDANNSVSYAYGGGAVVNIGSAVDGLSAYDSTVALAGIDNIVAGGDENFTVGNSSGFNDVTLGNGTDQVALGGDSNTVVLGNGNDSLTFVGAHDSAMLGTGNDAVTLSASLSSVVFASGDAGVTDTVTFQGGHDRIVGGDQNFTITGSKEVGPHIVLGNGTDTLNLPGVGGNITLGSTDLSNTSTDTVNVGKGAVILKLNGGVDNVTLADDGARYGNDRVQLNGTLLGTTLTAAGSYDTVTLTQDSNLALTDASHNGGLLLTIDADSEGGMGDISVTGLGGDGYAHIHLVNASSYTITVDQTQAGGVTVHFVHGSIDLIGLQAIPNNLFN
jgi:hypothetical protein